MVEIEKDKTLLLLKSVQKAWMEVVYKTKVWTSSISTILKVKLLSWPVDEIAVQALIL